MRLAPLFKSIKRFFKHCFSTPWQVDRYFPHATLKAIERAIKASEDTHFGEIRFVIEADLHPLEIIACKTPKKRALELFGQLGVWDTEHNNGVLIYLCLADRDVEIIADRGIHQRVRHAGWESICQAMEKHFRAGQFEAGALSGIALVGEVLAQHFPVGDEATILARSQSQFPRNELPNAPLIL